MWGFFLLATISVCSAYETERLIAFNETTSIWLPDNVVVKLESSLVNFMDITNHQTTKKSRIQLDPLPTVLSHQKLVKDLILDLEGNNLVDTITSLGQFYTRYYKSDTGKQAAEWTYNKFIEYSADRADVQVEYFQHNFKMPSVIARIQGSPSDIGATRVILGAHHDSIGSSSTGRSPGADDDGSGVSTILEIFRVLCQSGFKPNRTIEFHLYSGEEGGLLGSQDIAETYSYLDIAVEAMVQLDMTMYAPEPSLPLALFTDYVSPELTDFIGLVIDTYASLPYITAECGYACSDHASWERYGFRAAYPSESVEDGDPWIHSSKDLLQYLDVERGMEYAKVALGYLVEVAGQNKL